jgi:probable O-glycosylation ligase (exosortase A-associated)
MLRIRGQSALHPRPIPADSRHSVVMLRSIFVLGLMLVGLRYALKGPFYALLCYLWLAYFRPDRWLWFDFTKQLNLSFIVGVAVIGMTLFSRERFRAGVGPLLLAAFLVQTLLSTLFSQAFDTSWPYWQEFAKTMVMGYLIIVLVTTEERLRLTLTVMALSLAFETAKQGFAQFAFNPGTPNDNPSPMFGDNNGVAVGMMMLVPILGALATTASKRWERWLERVLAVGVLLRGIGTYSRGGFLAAAAIGLHYIARSRRFLGTAIVVAALGSIVVFALPRSYWNRMSTIQSDTEDPDAMDKSAASRLYFWQVALDMADDHPLFGVGHEAFSATYNKYDSSRGLYGYSRAVHSSWFGVLAETGYVGAAIFATMMGYALFACARARRAAKTAPELATIARYATAIEGALIGFAIGGSFVDLQFCEMLWHLFALAVVIDLIVAERIHAVIDAPRPLRGILATRRPVLTARPVASRAPLLR